jgi:hypothetical protein
LSIVERESVLVAAHNRFWRRQFYEHTRTGQLTVLRPDALPLHHCPELRWRPEWARIAALADLQRRLTITQVALAVLIVLVARGVNLRAPSWQQCTDWREAAGFGVLELRLRRWRYRARRV